MKDNKQRQWFCCNYGRGKPYACPARKYVDTHGDKSVYQCQTAQHSVHPFPSKVRLTNETRMYVYSLFALTLKIHKQLVNDAADAGTLTESMCQPKSNSKISLIPYWIVAVLIQKI